MRNVKPIASRKLITDTFSGLCVFGVFLGFSLALYASSGFRGLGRAKGVHLSTDGVWERGGSEMSRHLKEKKEPKKRKEERLRAQHAPTLPRSNTRTTLARPGLPRLRG